MKEKHPGKERRRYLRFIPTPEELEDLRKRSVEALGHVDLDMSKTEFRPTLLGLLADESHAGCSLIMTRSRDGNKAIQPGARCFVKAGALHPMEAVVRWRLDLDDHVFKAGFEFKA